MSDSLLEFCPNIERIAIEHRDLLIEVEYFAGKRLAEKIEEKPKIQNFDSKMYKLDKASFEKEWQ
jgi:hypothetical protein